MPAWHVERRGRRDGRGSVPRLRAGPHERRGRVLAVCLPRPPHFRRRRRLPAHDKPGLPRHALLCARRELPARRRVRRDRGGRRVSVRAELRGHLGVQLLRRPHRANGRGPGLGGVRGGLRGAVPLTWVRALFVLRGGQLQRLRRRKDQRGAVHDARRPAAQLRRRNLPAGLRDAGRLDLPLPLHQPALADGPFLLARHRGPRGRAGAAGVHVVGSNDGKVR